MNPSPRPARGLCRDCLEYVDNCVFFIYVIIRASTMILADIIAAIHLGYVVFVILGFILILVGIVLRWKWIRNLWFRILHLVAIALVALEALVGINCPLTVLEFELRYGGPPSERRVSFVGNIVDSILYYDAPAWLFATIYTSFAILVVITFIMAPPSRKSH